MFFLPFHVFSLHISLWMLLIRKMQYLLKAKLSSILRILMQSAAGVGGDYNLKDNFVFFVVGLPDDEEEKAEGFIGEVGGGFFLVRLMTRGRRPRAS